MNPPGGHEGGGGVVAHVKQQVRPQHPDPSAQLTRPVRPTREVYLVRLRHRRRRRSGHNAVGIGGLGDWRKARQRGSVQRRQEKGFGLQREEGQMGAFHLIEEGKSDFPPLVRCVRFGCHSELEFRGLGAMSTGGARCLDGDIAGLPCLE